MIIVVRKKRPTNSNDHFIIKELAQSNIQVSFKVPQEIFSEHLNSLGPTRFAKEMVGQPEENLLPFLVFIPSFGISDSHKTA